MPANTKGPCSWLCLCMRAPFDETLYPFNFPMGKDRCARPFLPRFSIEVTPLNKDSLQRPAMEQRHNGAGVGTGHPDHSGLQVVPVEGGKFPEVVSGPLSWKQEGAYAYALPPALKPGEHSAPEVAVSSIPERAASSLSPDLSPSHRPWWRRKRWIIMLAILIVVAAVLGGVLGTR